MHKKQDVYSCGSYYFWFIHHTRNLIIVLYCILHILTNTVSMHTGNLHTENAAVSGVIVCKKRDRRHAVWWEWKRCAAYQQERVILLSSQYSRMDGVMSVREYEPFLNPSRAWHIQDIQPTWLISVTVPAGEV